MQIQFQFKPMYNMYNVYKYIKDTHVDQETKYVIKEEISWIKMDCMYDIITH